MQAPVAHIDDAASLKDLLAVLGELHGSAYRFDAGRWEGATQVTPLKGWRLHRFVIDAQHGRLLVRPGDRVRGVPPDGPYHELGDDWAETLARHWMDLWPGDVLCVDESSGPAALDGWGSYFDVITEVTSYSAPRLAMLRHLPDRPGGCAAYPGAFRREALPPARSEPGAADQRGVNRLNEHTLDMRVDRSPGPGCHYHGSVPIGGGETVNHSETAIILPRASYDLPSVNGQSAAAAEQGHIVIYRQPADDPADSVVIPVRPGSIVVTPASADGSMGHRFENAFAMLVAIPGFVSKHNELDDGRQPNDDHHVGLHLSSVVLRRSSRTA